MLLLCGQLQAATVVFAVDQARDTVGNLVDSAAGAATGLLVVDVTGQGFGQLAAGQSTTVGSFLGADNNLKVVQRADFSLFATDGIWQSPVGQQQIDFVNGVAAGQELAFIWLPSMPTSQGTLAPGDAYGIAVFGNWVVPTQGGVANDYKLLSTTRNGLFDPVGSNSLLATDLQTYASSIVAVPEASHYATLFALMSVGLLLVAHRSKSRVDWFIQQ